MQSLTDSRRTWPEGNHKLIRRIVVGVIAVLLGLSVLTSHLVANTSQHLHPSYSACGETVCNITITTSTKQLLRSQWQRIAWLWTGTQKYREGNIRYHDIEEQGPVSLRTKTSQHHEEISIEAWVQLNNDLDHIKESTIVAFGPFSLQLKAPGTPQMLIKPTAMTFQAGFELYRGRRGNCGNMELVNIETASIVEAARLCTIMPGCNAVTRQQASGQAWFCRGVYGGAEEKNPEWSLLLRDGASTSLDYKASMPLHAWQHVAATYNSISRRLSIYLNGLLVQSMFADPPDVYTNTSTADIGHSFLETWKQSLPGKVGNVRIWSRELSLLEVQESMLSEHLDPSTPDLLLDAGQPNGWILHVSSLPPAPDAAPPTPWLSGFPQSKMAFRPARLDASGPDPRPGTIVAIVIPHVGWEEHAVTRTTLRMHRSAGCDRCVLRFVHTFQRPLPDSSAAPVLSKLSAKLDAPVTTTSPSAGQDKPGQAWTDAVREALDSDAVASSNFVVLADPSVLPTPGWLQGLLADLDGQKNVAAVHSKVLYPDGSIAHLGVEYQVSYIPDMDEQLPVPVEALQGYPLAYARALQPRRVDGTRCMTLLVRREALMAVSGAFQEAELGPEYSCVDLALRLQEKGNQVMVAPNSIVFVPDMPDPRTKDFLPPFPPVVFYQIWRGRLLGLVQQRTEVQLTTTYNMHCGGSMGIEAFNFLQGLEGRLPMHSQITRGGIYCEHANVLEGTPSSFSARVNRMRQLSGYIPAQVFIHHKDYRDAAQYVWPVERPKSYLIGRYMFEVDKIHTQWAEQIRDQLDEVWVPSHWHQQLLARQGVSPSKVAIIPESLDTALFDPALWPSTGLPGKRRYAFLAVFKLEDRKGWKEVLQAYMQEFKASDDVSLIIHTVTYPELLYRQDMILLELQSYLTSLNITNTLFMGDSKLPHIHVTGQHLSQMEMLRLYSTVDAFVLASHGEGWGLPYMEAMAMGLPCIATNWSGMTEFMTNDVALMLNYSIGPVSGSNSWFEGTNWANPDTGMLRQHMRWLYENPEKGRRIGEAARKRIQRNYDNFKVGNIIIERLKQIKQRLDSADRMPPPRQLDPHTSGVEPDIQVCAEFGQSLAQRQALRAADPVRSPNQPISIAVISTWPPTACGVASFALNSITALQQVLPAGSRLEVFPLVPDAGIDMHGKDRLVARTIRRDNLQDYMAAAHYINENKFHVVLMQHEFGIWGGTFGSYAICFARMLRPASVAVVHTLSDNLYDQHHYNLFQLANAVDRVVVMSPASRNAMGTYHAVAKSRVAVVPHGVPHIQQIDALKVKAELGWSNRIVLLTNGLLHPGKGIDLVLNALPGVVKHHPEVLYVVMGKPHPSCGKVCVHHLEMLRELVDTHHLGRSVAFMEKFSSEEELIRILQAADVYITPYKDRITSNSGTLSMAMAAGKLVVSTPFEHAKYVVPGRGVLVPFEDPVAMQDALLGILAEPQRAQQLAAAAYQYASKLTWSMVAAQYHSLFDKLTVGGRMGKQPEQRQAQQQAPKQQGVQNAQLQKLQRLLGVS